jgi:hypothetical protein
MVQDCCPSLEIEQVRGFRIVSGGPLRPLESYRWWWQFNRRLGARLPSLCTEVQVVAQKPFPKTIPFSLPLRRAA